MTLTLRVDSVPDEHAHDLTLARRASRDRHAFAALYQRYLPSVYRFALARLGVVEAAEEVTAQTFEVALQQIDRYEGRAALSTWLIGIARNKANDHLRRQRPTVSLDDATALIDDAPALETLAEQGLQLEQVAALMRSITPDRAEALALRFYAGLSVRETAETMGKSEAAVKMLVYRAVRELRERLAPQEEQS